MEVRREPWTDDIYEKARLAFEMNHEMSYHEMCAVIKKLRAENERLNQQVDDLKDRLWLLIERCG